MTIMQKSERHSKITGDFGESLILYFLSKYHFEPAFVDHTGIDIIAYNKLNQQRFGISVKSRSRTLQRPNDGLLVDGHNYQKIMDSCVFFAADPYICYILDVPSSEYTGTIHLFLMSLDTLNKYYPTFSTDKDFTFSITKKNLEKYDSDKKISKLKFDYSSQYWERPQTILHG